MSIRETRQITKKCLVIGKSKEIRALSTLVTFVPGGQRHPFRTPTEWGKQIPEPFYLGLSNTGVHQKFSVDENT